MKKVLVYGAYDLDNLGDDYMMYQIDKIINKNNIQPIYLKNTNKPINYFNLVSNNKFDFHIDKKNKIIKLIEYIKWFFNKENINDLNALIFMGGGYTNENFGLAKLIRMFILTSKFKKNDKKIYFTGQTVGPAKGKLYTFFLKKMYQQGDKIIVREKYSQEYLKKLKIKSELVGDDAFLTDENVIVNNQRNKIIFNYKDFKGYEEYKEKYFNFLLEVALKLKKEVYVIPFRSSKDSKEYKTNFELYKYLRVNKVNAKFVVERNMEDFQNIFKTSELVIGTAYHSIVLGLLFGNQVYSAYLGDYYRVKIKGILDWYNMSETNSIDIKEIDNKKNSIIRQILNKANILDNSKKVTKELEENVKKNWNEIINEILTGE